MRKAPWEMSPGEWEHEFEACHPDNMQTNYTKRSGAEAVRKFERFIHLRFDICRPRHVMIIRKALYLGLPVPPEVAAEYVVEVRI